MVVVLLTYKQKKLGCLCRSAEPPPRVIFVSQYLYVEPIRILLPSFCEGKGLGRVWNWFFVSFVP